MCVVHGAKEPLAAVVNVGVVLVPAQPVVVASSQEHVVDVVSRAKGDLEEAGQVGRAARIGQGGRVLGRQRVLARSGVVLDVATGGLRIEPFPGVGLPGPGGRSQLPWCDRSCSHCGVVAQLVAEHDQGRVQSGADLIDGFENERHEFVDVNGGCLL